MASLIFEHLKKVYPNGFVSVDDVSLSIEDGEFVVFHGPSGCGKSTILRMIGGLEDITSGKIYLDNTFLNDILPRDRKLAMAFQNCTESVAENTRQVRRHIAAGGSAVRRGRCSRKTALHAHELPGNPETAGQHWQNLRRKRQEWR